MSILDTPVQPSAMENLITDENAYSAAYEAASAEIAAVPESDLEPINIDINAATTTALGALPEILAQRDAMRRTLADFDVRSLDRLETYASATLYLHSAVMTQSAPSPELPLLVERATKMRDAFVADAQALVQRGLLDAAVINERPRGPGHKALALELLSLTLRLRASWSVIAGRSALEYTELGTAEALCKRIQRLVGLREQAGPARTAVLALERQKAFTLFVRAYDDVRKALSYLRWKQGDVDGIAPSLYAGRGGRKRVSEDEGALEKPAASRSTMTTLSDLPEDEPFSS